MSLFLEVSPLKFFQNSKSFSSSSVPQVIAARCALWNCTQPAAVTPMLGPSKAHQFGFHSRVQHVCDNLFEFFMSGQFGRPIRRFQSLVLSLSTWRIRSLKLSRCGQPFAKHVLLYCTAGPDGCASPGQRLSHRGTLHIHSLKQWQRRHRRLSTEA